MIEHTRYPRLEIRRPARRLLTLSGELDMATGAALQEAVADERGGGDLVLDLSGLTFMDSTGIRLIVSFAAAAAGANVVLLDVPPSVLRVLQVSGIDGKLDNLVVIPRDG